jgi:hypothetical protein
MNSDFDQDETITPLLPHYVYVLADPADQSVFYVGKGQGKRVSHHWSEARRDAGTDTAKLARLRDLIARELAPLELIIGRYETEDEAFAVEATLIKWVYGFENLTNAVHGHGQERIRALGNFEAVANIDREHRPAARDGEYSKNKIAGLMDAGAYDYNNDLTAALRDAGFDVRDFTDTLDRPYRPDEGTGFLGLLIRVENIDFIIYFSKMKKPQIRIATTLSSRRARPLLVNHGWKLAEPTNLPAGPPGQKERRFQSIASPPNAILEDTLQTDWSFDTEAIEPVVQTFRALKHSIAGLHALPVTPA